ncbi:MAG: 4Fe-4S dicluster domain-containing protein [Thermodesulfobacteriota bacterium]
MKITIGAKNLRSEFVQLLERMSGEDLSKCYQCGNCSGGCPVAFAMDVSPHHIIRLLQLGQEDAVLKANTMWLCVSCLQCYSRCPKFVDLSKILEALRQVGLRKGIDHIAVKKLPVDLLAKSPQQTLVAGFRKLVS